MTVLPEGKMERVFVVYCWLLNKMVYTVTKWMRNYGFYNTNLIITDC